MMAPDAVRWLRVVHTATEAERATHDRSPVQKFSRLARGKGSARGSGPIDRMASDLICVVPVDIEVECRIDGQVLQSTDRPVVLDSLPHAAEIKHFFLRFVVRPLV